MIDPNFEIAALVGALRKVKREEPEPEPEPEPVPEPGMGLLDGNDFKDGDS